jgi:hypothetical protein
MNSKSLIIKTQRGVLILMLVFAFFSCKKDFLDVTEPSAISPDVFPAKVEDLDLMLNDLYGRIRSGFFHSDQFAAIGVTLDHVADQTSPGSTYGDMLQNSILPTHPLVSVLWTKQYEGVSRSNAFLEALSRFRAKGVTPAEEDRLKLMEGQGLFIRAFFYYYLVNFFSEVPLTTEADKAKLAVPLWDKVPESVEATNKERATIGAVWDFIISDLEKAEVLMAGKTVWDAANRARADIWSVKGFLAKAYLFDLQYEKARDKAKEIIDQSGKTLVPYSSYHDMFNGNNEFNSESLFEINFTNDRQDLGTDIFTNVYNTSNQYMLVIGPTYIAANGLPTPNGFGNLFLHDANVRRFGFKLNAFTAAEQSDPAYIAQSIAIRNNKEADPRLYVSTMQPYVDSVQIANVYRKVGKAAGGSFDLTHNRAWSHRKYTLLTRGWTEDFGYAFWANMYFLRLADIYLIYAEALINTGDNTVALEYINKVKRRAYGLPIDAPSAIDYTSLTSPTSAAPTDHLANDPLKYERWAEFFAEGQWWFDVRRWRIGDKEAAYFDSVQAGKLIWDDHKYALPIPEVEMNNNNKIQKQNDGY